jgi:hypothetical protein
MQGPVYDAAHNAPTVGGALFGIAIGLSALIYLWHRTRRQGGEEPKIPQGNAIGIALICCVIIVIGIWEWIRAAF